MPNEARVGIDKHSLARLLLTWVPVGAIVGAVVLFVIKASHGQIASVRFLTFGGLIGSLSCLWCILLLRWSQRLLERLPGIWIYPGLAMTFVVGGWLGWYSAAGMANFLLDIRWTPSLSGIGLDLLISAIASIGVGLTIFFIERLKDKLRLSVIQIKEQEFACKELELAGSIQRRLMPASRIERDDYVINSHHTPARYVAGDFFDVFQLGKNSVGIVVADVVGKGMGASLIMASVKAMVPFFAADYTITETMYRLNERLCDELAPREFVAMALARVDPVDGTVQIANAGLPNPYVLRPGHEAAEISVPQPRVPLGSRRKVSYQHLELKLDVGEQLLFITDGMPEASIENGEPLGYEAFAKMLAGARQGTKPLLEQLVFSLREHTQDEQSDDWTALLFERI